MHTVLIMNVLIINILTCLNGKVPLNFKRAVFIYENTYLKGTLNYENFSNYFSTTANTYLTIL